jgi:uncharacterized protein involved in type VI secretion and phage assembly
MSGVVIGVVTEREDPSCEGRIKVKFPWLDETTFSTWAPVASPMAGNGRGAFLMPEIDDEVLVAFEHGDFDHPHVVGFLWNGVDEPPSSDVRQRIIRSKNGHAIRFVDSSADAGSMGALIIEDAHGNCITLSNGKITIKSTAIIDINAPLITLSGPGYHRLVVPSSNPI